MADAIIDVVGQDEMPTIVELYNQIFRPARDAESFVRRYRGRYNVLQMIARVKDRPVGLFLGFDSRDNVISPAKGHRIEIRPAYYGEVFGGDDEWR